MIDGSQSPRRAAGRPRRSLRTGLAATSIALAALPATAQDASQDLAKQLANPIANLASLPFQFNYDRDVGPGEGERLTLNIQPVVPFDLNDDWLLISRTIIPVISLDGVIPGQGSEFGTGDVLQSLFFSPKGTGSLTWGVGPVLLLPTATEDTLGTEKWAIGPTGVALVQNGPWTYGALANHLWSFAGSSGRDDVNATFLQPFVNYTLPSATTFFANSEASYDWEQDQWSVPVNVGVNQLTTIGNQNVQIGAGLRYWVESPETGPEGWGARINLTFLFPV